MKMKKQWRPLNLGRFLFLSLILLISMTHTNAQVTIGLTEEPMQGSLLQLKNIEGATGSAANANKGVSMPRLLLTKKHELYPMFLKDVTRPALGPTDEYVDQKATLRPKAHRFGGL